MRDEDASREAKIQDLRKEAEESAGLVARDEGTAKLLDSELQEVSAHLAALRTAMAERQSKDIEGTGGLTGQITSLETLRKRRLGLEPG